MVAPRNRNIKRVVGSCGEASEPLSIVYRNIEELKADPENPRLHSGKQIQQIARSIETFGFSVPLLVDRKLKLIAGHGRLAASKLLGIRRVPTVSLQHLSEVQARAFMIADNRLSENATWDDRLLAEQFKILAEVKLDFNLEVTGFDVGEIDVMIDGLTPARAGEEDPADRLPEMESAVQVTQVGDLWLLGHNRLVCGYALDGSAYSLLMDGRRSHAAFTAPRYHDSIDGETTGFGKVHHTEFAMASGEMSQVKFTEFLSKALSHMVNSSDAGALHYICIDWRHIGNCSQLSDASVLRSRTCACGCKTPVGTEPFIAVSMSSCWFSGTAKLNALRTSSQVSTAAIAQTSGNTPG